MALDGTHFLLYTTEEGGAFHVTRCTPAEYKNVLLTREVNVNMFNNAVVTDPALVALLAVVEENHDFILGRSRDDS